MKINARFFLFAAGYGFCLTLMLGMNSFPAQAASVTWDGGGSDGTCGGGVGDGNKWSCAANWSTDTVPVPGDLVFFDATSVKDATVDTNIQISGMNIAAGYTGTITQSTGIQIDINSHSITNHGYNQSGGTFMGGDTYMHAKSFRLTGGIFTATSATTEVNYDFLVSGGTFNHNNGTIAVGGADATNTFVTWNVPTTVTFYDFEMTGKCGGGGINMGSGDTFVILGTYNHTCGEMNTGTIDLQGDATFTDTGAAVTGTATVQFGNNAASQTITVTDASTGTFSVLPIVLNSAADASDHIALASNATFRSLQMTSGFSGAVPFENPSDFVPTFTIWDQAAGTYDASTQTTWAIGTFTLASGATFISPTTINFIGGGATWDVPTTFDLDNLNINTTGALTVATNDTIRVNGTLTLTNGRLHKASTSSLVSGTLEALGPVVPLAGFDGASSEALSGTLKIISPISQTINLANASYPKIIYNSPGSTMNGPATGTASFRTFSALDGSFLAGAGELSFADFTLGGTSTFTGSTGSVSMNSLTIEDSSVFTAPSGTLTVSGPDWTHTDGTSTFNHNGGTVVFSGFASGVNADVNETETFNDVTLAFSNSDNWGRGLGIYDASDTLVVTGLLTLQGGKLDGNGYLEAQGDVTHTAAFGSGATFHGGFGKLKITGPARTITSVSGGNWPSIILDSLGTNIDFPASGTTRFGSRATAINTPLIVQNGTVNGGAGILDIVGDLIVEGGTMTASSDTTVVVYDFTHTGGTFNHSNGTVTMDGSNQALVGTTFYNFTKIVGGADTLTFPAGSTETFLGTLTLKGASKSARLSLRSSTPGSFAFIDPQGPRDIRYLDVQDNNNSNAAVMRCVLGCINSGNNINWFFGILTVESGGTTDVAEQDETSDTFTVTLDAVPTDTVLVDLGFASGDFVTDPSQLTFTTSNWDDPQTVTVTAVDDLDDEADLETIPITLTASSSDLEYDGITAEVLVNVTDDDTPVIVSSISGDTTEAGGTATFTVSLSSPLESWDYVAIYLYSDNPAEGNPDTNVLYFWGDDYGYFGGPGDWRLPQTVTVTGVDDAFDDGNTTYHIILDPIYETFNQYYGVDPKNVTVVNLDNEIDGYDYQQTITVDADQVMGSEDLIDFPLLVSLTDANLRTTSNGGKVENANGYDIIFTDLSDVQLDHEVESYDASTGELIAWVRVPTLDFDDDTSILMYYGNDDISTSQEDIEGTWSDGYKGVWHLSEDPSGSAPQMLDSTSNDLDGTSVGSMNSGDQFSFKVDGGIAFDGVDDYIETPLTDNTTVDITDTLTASFWTQCTPGQDYNEFFSKSLYDAFPTDYGWEIWSETGIDKIQFDIVTLDGYGLVSSTATICDGSTLVYVVGTYDGANLRLYINGVEDDVTTLTGEIDDNSYPLLIGSYFEFGSPALFLDGQMDEVRLSNVAKSAGWIATEYFNQNDPSAFVTFGPEENVGGGGGGGGTNLRTGTITLVKQVINDDGGTKTVSDFPLYINGKRVVSGQTNTYSFYTSGVYRVSETGASGYRATFSGDCDANGNIYLEPGEHTFCYVTNDDIAFTSVQLYGNTEALASATTINIDKGLALPPAGARGRCLSGMLMKLADDRDPTTQVDSAIYYCGLDEQRYVFPNAEVYFTWYPDFSGVQIVSPEMLAAVPLAGNVTYRPGSRMVKIQSDPRVYAIAKGGILRWVTDEMVASQLSGMYWNRTVSDVPDGLFNSSYDIGDPIHLDEVIPPPPLM